MKDFKIDGKRGLVSQIPLWIKFCQNSSPCTFGYREKPIPIRWKFIVSKSGTDTSSESANFQKVNCGLVVTLYQLWFNQIEKYFFVLFFCLNRCQRSVHTVCQSDGTSCHREDWEQRLRPFHQQPSGSAQRSPQRSPYCQSELVKLG